MGIPWAVSISIDLQYAVNRVSLIPALQPQRICRYTSPGFLLLEELARGHFDGIDYGSGDSERIALQWDEALAQKVSQIKRLFLDRQVSHKDVDPAGNTWLQVSLTYASQSHLHLTAIQKILKYPWSPGLRSAQFELLEFLVGMSQFDIQSDSR